MELAPERIKAVIKAPRGSTRFQFEFFVNEFNHFSSELGYFIIFSSAHVEKISLI